MKLSEPAFICSKSTMETLKRLKSLDTVLLSLLLTLNKFDTCSGVSSVYFEQVNIGLLFALYN